MEVIVFKLELDDEKSRWVEIKSLGDAALFLGDNSSIYVCALDLVGCKPNCVYFSHDDNRTTLFDPDTGPSDLGMYNLENKSIENFTLHHVEDSALVAKMIAQPPIWVLPTLNTY
ncbi:hypothetical protein TorRG33x02_125150 [Trema orientale]|uniref:KIB1-4 beta-propeller domain-containing protein n=1 Tax=Trema orientale TaxID=63057 RepID=A0A2P5F1L6_TREOI|nr:hypothetical protein TorRG33x02_125150 [Trema orientale]